MFSKSCDGAAINQHVQAFKREIVILSRPEDKLVVEGGTQSMPFVVCVEDDLRNMGFARGRDASHHDSDV